MPKNMEKEDTCARSYICASVCEISRAIHKRKQLILYTETRETKLKLLWRSEMFIRSIECIFYFCDRAHNVCSAEFSDLLHDIADAKWLFLSKQHELRNWEIQQSKEGSSSNDKPDVWSKGIPLSRWFFLLFSLQIWHLIWSTAYCTYA